MITSVQLPTEWLIFRKATLRTHLCQTCRVRGSCLTILNWTHDSVSSVSVIFSRAYVVKMIEEQKSTFFFEVFELISSLYCILGSLSTQIHAHIYNSGHGNLPYQCERVHIHVTWLRLRTPITGVSPIPLGLVTRATLSRRLMVSRMAQ